LLLPLPLPFFLSSPQATCFAIALAFAFLSVIPVGDLLCQCSCLCLSFCHPRRGSAVCLRCCLCPRLAPKARPHPSPTHRAGWAASHEPQGLTARPKMPPQTIFFKNRPKIACQAPKSPIPNIPLRIRVTYFPCQFATIKSGANRFSVVGKVTQNQQPAP